MTCKCQHCGLGDMHSSQSPLGLGSGTPAGLGEPASSQKFHYYQLINAAFASFRYLSCGFWEAFYNSR